MNTLADKRVARTAVKALLKAARSDDLAAQSAAICRRVLQLAQYHNSTVIAAYLTCLKLKEVDTQHITADALARKIKLYVPVVADKDSNMRMLHLDSMSCVRQVPPFGIQEPVAVYDDGSPRQELLQDGNAEFPGVILLPGLGFDREGRRLGRGGGYYDKFLARVLHHAAQKQLPRPHLVGLCFREQLCERVPVDEHDQCVDWLVTPDEVIDCRKLASRANV